MDRSKKYFLKLSSHWRWFLTNRLLVAGNGLIYHPHTHTHTHLSERTRTQVSFDKKSNFLLFTFDFIITSWLNCWRKKVGESFRDTDDTNNIFAGLSFRSTNSLLETESNTVFTKTLIQIRSWKVKSFENVIVEEICNRMTMKKDDHKPAPPHTHTQTKINKDLALLKVNYTHLFPKE